MNIIPYPVTAGESDLVLCVAKGNVYKIEDEKRHTKANLYRCMILKKGVKATPFKLKTAGPQALAAKNSQIYIYDRKNKGTYVDFPRTIYANLHKFLQNGRPERGFCCVDFVTYLFEKYSPKNHNNLNMNDWEFAPFTASKIVPGEAVVLYSNVDPFLPKGEETDLKRVELKHLEAEHFAVYVGKKIYLSLFGKKGPLVFTTLKELQKFYSTSAEPLKGVKVLKPL